MLDLLWRVRFRRKLHPRQATGDTTYGTVENIVALEDAGIRAYVPLPDMNHRRPFYRPGRLHLRRGPGRVPLPSRSPAGSRAGQAHRGGHRLPGRCRDLQCLPTQGGVHGKQPRPHRPSLALRRLPGAGARLPRHRGLQEGHAQAPGLGRAAVRRGQALAWLTPLPAAGAGERQHRGAADRGRAEPEALPGRDRLGRRHAPCGSLVALPREPRRLSAVSG